MASLCSAVRMPAGRSVCLRRRSILTCARRVRLADQPGVALATHPSVAASFTPVTTKTELKANGGRVVKEVGGKVRCGGRTKGLVSPPPLPSRGPAPC